MKTLKSPYISIAYLQHTFLYIIHEYRRNTRQKNKKIQGKYKESTGLLSKKTEHLSRVIKLTCEDITSSKLYDKLAI